MKTLNIILVGVFLLVTFISVNSGIAEASVPQGHEYQATTTVAMAANGHRIIATSTTNRVSLGSIIIASSTSAAVTSGLRIWNATSTTDVGSTSIVLFAPQASNGTYTFDAILSRGLIVELPANFNGSYTITYRP